MILDHGLRDGRICRGVGVETDRCRADGRPPLSTSLSQRIPSRIGWQARSSRDVPSC
jgi:hypothetical protein